jgi:methylated-DNA-[protein]-cysteine S-methyltransferase
MTSLSKLARETTPNFAELASETKHSFTSIVDTPAGLFLMVTDSDGAVLAAGWTTDVGDLLPLVHPSLRAEPEPRTDLGPATAAVRAYLDGDLTAPAAVPVRQRSDGPFLTSAWEALRKVEPGEPISYTEFAVRTGRPTATRAAALACARNAAALFVPCHRIVRSDGGLGGFRWGLDVKRWLIAHESGV